MLRKPDLSGGEGSLRIFREERDIVVRPGRLTVAEKDDARLVGGVMTPQTEARTDDVERIEEDGPYRLLHRNPVAEPGTELNEKGAIDGRVDRRTGRRSGRDREKRQGMLEKLQKWIEAKPEPTQANGVWVLTIRPPLPPVPAVEGGVYEWGLTLIAPVANRECRINGIWFVASADATLGASGVIEQMRNEQELGAEELQMLIERYRTPQSSVHLTRTIGTVKRNDVFESAYCKEFVETLKWGGIGSLNPSGGKPCSNGT